MMQARIANTFGDVAQQKIDALNSAYWTLYFDPRSDIIEALPSEHKRTSELREFIRAKFREHNAVTFEGWASMAFSAKQWKKMEGENVRALSRDAQLRWITAMILAIRNGTEVQGDWE